MAPGGASQILSFPCNSKHPLLNRIYSWKELESVQMRC